MSTTLFVDYEGRYFHLLDIQGLLKATAEI